jgi:hypothetical protein
VKKPKGEAEPVEEEVGDLCSGEERRITAPPFAKSKGRRSEEPVVGPRGNSRRRRRRRRLRVGVGYQFQIARR